MHNSIHDLACAIDRDYSAKSRIHWGPEQQAIFDKFKEALTKAPILALPDVNKQYVLYTDASDNCIGTILVQKYQEGGERAIQFVSHKLSDCLIGLTEMPDVWESDYVNVSKLIQFQRKQFPDEFIEVDQGTDETKYIVEKGILYKITEPHTDPSAPSCSMWQNANNSMCIPPRGNGFSLTFYLRPKGNTSVDHLTGWAESIPIASKKTSTV